MTNDIRVKTLNACYTSELYRQLPIEKKNSVYDSVKKMFEETNKTEKYYFCKDTETIYTSNELKEQYNRDNDGFETFNDFIERLTDPWECLKEVSGITDYYKCLFWVD